jgi:predicted DNA-binding transcriptional regulator YafY
MEMQVLQMCRQFTAHLLGRELFEEATRALLKSQALLGTAREPSPAHFAAFRSGTIDYTPYHDTIQALIEAMEAKKVCKISYQAVGENRAKTFYIKPLKIFSYRDALYLHAQKAMDTGRRFRAPEFDPLLAVHRMKDVEMMEWKFEFPQNYDFEKIFNRTFGIIKQETFEVEAEFTGWAAKYVAERVWSPDQRITRLGPGAIRLTFSASSEPEVLSWVLSFGEEARVLRPECMVERVRNAIEAMRLAYKPD